MAEERRGEQEEFLDDYSICVGRDLERRLIRDWVENGHGGFRVVTASAGMGKTAFMRAIRDDLRNDGIEVKAFFFRAGTKFDSLEVMQEFISEEDLRESPAITEKRVIVIDAVDEALRHLNELRWNWRLLAENVFVIVSVRAPDDDNDLLELPTQIRSVINKGHSPIEPSPRIRLGSFANWQEVEEWVQLAAQKKGLDSGQIQGLDGHVQSLWLASHGYPLYLSFLLMDIEQEAKFPNVTRDWDEYVAETWEALCRRENRDWSHLLLPLVAAARRDFNLAISSGEERRGI